MSERPPKPANDNFTEAELRRGEQAVVAFSGEAKIAEEELQLDGLCYKALQTKVSAVGNNYPFLLTDAGVAEAEHAISNLSYKDVIRMVNSIDPGTLEDTKVTLYQALLNRLHMPVVEE